MAVDRLPDRALQLDSEIVASIPGAFALQDPLPKSAVTLGTFDGVHLGHQALIRRAVDRAEEHEAACVAYTFDPHPAKVLAPKVAPPVLLPINMRVRSIAKLGVDLVVVEPFTRAFSEVSADEWVERFLVERLRPAHVVIGFNFSYGKDRGGGPEHLAGCGADLGFGVDVVQPVELEGAVVSSTRIRQLLLEGQVEDARRLLGRPYPLTGLVIEGDKRGREIGVRTANLSIEGELMPAAGVYASIVSTEDGTMHRAVTNIGVRPTFTAGRAVEAHLLDFEGDLYGQRLAVSLIARLRPEQKFSGASELTAQIHRDIAEARERLVRE